ncbi:MAG: PP2C family serine/threonine-protein phosphatase [Blastocatellia bacterium]
MAEGVNAADEATSVVATVEPKTATDGAAAPEWRVVGETVRGASHLRSGTPNQDAILQVRESSTGLPLVLSISDGHGSDKCFRSDRGSRLAVAIGADLMRGAMKSVQRKPDVAQIESYARDTLPAEFTLRWKQAVEADLEREPLTEGELSKLEAKDRARARQLVESHPLLAYGATTLTVGLADTFVVYLQLGDGEIITVSETGKVSKPLPEDERLMANETTSLCSDTAAQDFRFACQPLPDPPPALILMTTDGYANSFTDDAGFLKVGSDILEMLHTDGFDAVNRSVRGWLEEATRMGSGDDCTLGIICRLDTLEARAPANPTVVAEAEARAQSLLPAESAEAATGGEAVQTPEQK